MSSESLPTFQYHPDPISTGSVARSDQQCVVCRESRGYVYTGPVYADGEYDESICPWCIADGSAHEELGATFHDGAAVPGSDFLTAPPVDDAIIAEVCERTPGFSGWQQEQWFTCCSDAAAFLGRAVSRELKTLWPEAIPSLQESTGMVGEEWDELLESLDRKSGPTAYVFRCLHCGKYGAYQDSD